MYAWGAPCISRDECLLDMVGISQCMPACRGLIEDFKPSTASTLDELSVSLEGATQPCSYVSRRWVGVVAILPHGRRGAMAAWGARAARRHFDHSRDECLLDVYLMCT